MFSVRARLGARLRRVGRVPLGLQVFAGRKAVREVNQFGSSPQVVRRNVE